MILATRTGRRRLWPLHPAITTVVVVGTANHSVADAVAAWLLLAVILIVAGLPLRSAPVRGRVREASTSPKE